MNKLQKQNLIHEATQKSKCFSNDVLYILIKDNQGKYTFNVNIATALINQGFKLYLKMLNGNLIL